MAVPILFDGYKRGSSQEIVISRLSRMALPPANGEEPPIITITGHGLPTPGPKKWVIENLEWGTNVIYDTDPRGHMARMRQDCVINLLQYVGDDRAAFSRLTPGKRGGSPSKPGSKGFQKPYVIKQGDNIRKIANKVYKDPSPGDVKLIRKANGMVDPRHLKAGKTLKIPKK